MWQLHKTRKQSKVSHRKDLGQQGGCEEGGVLDDHVVTLILVGHIQLIQQVVGGLADLHYRNTKIHMLYQGEFDPENKVTGLHRDIVRCSCRHTMQVKQSVKAVYQDTKQCQVKTLSGGLFVQAAHCQSSICSRAAFVHVGRCENCRNGHAGSSIGAWLIESGSNIPETHP